MLGTALDLGSSLLGLLRVWKPEDESLKENQGYIQKAQRINNLLGSNSITASAQKTMIRPMVGIEKSLTQAEWATDLMTIIQLRDILAVLTHLELQGSVNGVSISSLVDSVNPRRSGLASYAGLESIGGSNILPGMSVSGMEAAFGDDPNQSELRFTTDGKAYTSLNEYYPLALGRTVKATTQLGSEKVEFPLTFRQIPMPTPTEGIKNVFEAAKIEDGLMARIDLKTADLITTPQLLTGSDIIKDKFRIRMRDLTGMYTEALKRDRNNKRAALATGMFSMNTLANTYVMSSSTAAAIELQIGKRFANANQREHIWSKVLANTIVVVNEGLGTFTFYTMGDPLPETYTRNEIKTKAGKESSVGSLQDLMKLLNGGL